MDECRSERDAALAAAALGLLGVGDVDGAGDALRDLLSSTRRRSATKRTRWMPIDPYDCREKVAAEKAYWEDRPDVLAVYAIIRAFNRHRHESASLADARLVVEREVPRPRHYRRSLRRQTERMLARDQPLTEAEYKALMMRWFEFKRELEEGVALIPYVVVLLLLGIVVLIAYLLIRR